MNSKWFITAVTCLFLISCGNSVSSKSMNGNDNDSIAVTDDDFLQTDDVNIKDDETVNDNELQNDNDSIVNDDVVPDEDISATCGNSNVEWPEICDGGMIDCVNIDNTLYSGGMAECKNNCTGWNTVTCEELKQNECTNGARQCYGAYQYKICDDYDDDGYTEWGNAQTCSNNETCSGEGLCSNDCHSHNYYECYNGNVHWYNSCGTREEQKKSCGTSGYTGSNYCYDDDVYKDYVTRGCNDHDCTESTEAVFQEDCSNGCTSGSCNAAEDISWYDSTSELTWQNSKFSAALSLSSASSYCSSLTFDGYSDWRLPTISELRSLIRGCSNAETEGSCKVTDYCSSWETCTASCFSCTSGNGPSGDNNYWDSNLDGGETSLLSATPVPGYSGYNWYIDFTTAEISYSFDTAATNFRCVRGTMPGDTLTAPTNVTASDGDFDNYIIISWDKVPGATNYNIYRSTSPLSGYSHLQNLGVTDYSIDYPPHASITYYYKISAYNSTYGESELSSYASGWCY